MDAVCSGSLLQVGRELCNVFEQALRLPETEMLKREMNRFHPLGCLMTGADPPFSPCSHTGRTRKNARKRCG